MMQLQPRTLVAGFLFLAVTVTTAHAQAKTKKRAAAPASLHLVVAPTGNEARYKVREQLVGLDLPNDAIGKTQNITGEIVVEPNGTIVSDSSRIVVNVASLKSDKSRRDLYIKSHSLETNKFPTVEIVPRGFVGLSAKPGATPFTFDMTGDLTVRGVSRPTTWKVTAHSDGSALVGTASTAFTFKDFDIDQPSVAVVLAVEDTIKLEYDFRLAPADPKTR